jgi:hypothetical protein
MWVQTHECLHCGDASLVSITEDEAYALSSGESITKAFPARDADFREMFITGTHPACWEEMFAGGEDEDERCEALMDSLSTRPEDYYDQDEADGWRIANDILEDEGESYEAMTDSLPMKWSDDE